jgi:hypothetical protein
VTSDLRREVDENCALQGCFAASSGDMSRVRTQPWNISTRLPNVLSVGYVLVEHDAASATFRNREMP